MYQIKQQYFTITMQLLFTIRRTLRNDLTKFNNKVRTHPIFIFVFVFNIRPEYKNWLLIHSDSLVACSSELRQLLE